MKRGSAVGVQPWNVTAIPARPASPTAAINILAETGMPSDRPCSTFQFLGPRPNNSSLELDPSLVLKFKKNKTFCSQAPGGTYIFKVQPGNCHTLRSARWKGNFIEGKGLGDQNNQLKPTLPGLHFLLCMQGDGRIHPGCTQRWNQTGRNSHRQNEETSGCEGQRVGWPDAKQESRH
jgi:hypothetical protein